MEWFLLILGGGFNLYQVVSKIPDNAPDSQIVKTGWIAFIMGAIIYGGILNLIYMIFK
jgi:hypothetical protein